MNLSYNGKPIIKYGNIAVSIPANDYIADVEISFSGTDFETIPCVVVSAMHGSNAGVYAKIKSIGIDSAVISVCTPDAVTVAINCRLYWIAISTLHN